MEWDSDRQWELVSHLKFFQIFGSREQDIIKEFNKWEVQEKKQLQ